MSGSDGRVGGHGNNLPVSENNPGPPAYEKSSSTRSSRDAPGYRWSEDEEELIAKARYELRGDYKELVGKQGSSFWLKVWAQVKSWDPAWDRPVDAVKVKIHRLERKYRDILEQEAQPGAVAVQKPLWWKWLSLYMEEKMEEERQAAREAWRDGGRPDGSDQQTLPSSFRPFSQTVGPIQPAYPPPPESPSDGLDGSQLQQLDRTPSAKRKRDSEAALAAEDSLEQDTELNVKKKKGSRKKGGLKDGDLSGGAAGAAADANGDGGAPAKEASTKDYERWSEREQVLVARARFELHDEYKKRPAGQQGSFYGRLKEYIRSTKEPSFDRPFEAIKLKLHRMERKYRVIKERVREREPGDASAENGEGANAHLVLKPKCPSRSDAPGEGLVRRQSVADGTGWKTTKGAGGSNSMLLPPSASVNSQPNATGAGGASGAGGENAMRSEAANGAANSSATGLVGIVNPGAMSGAINGAMPPPPHILTSPPGFLPPPPPGFFPPGTFFAPGVFPHSFSATSSSFRPPAPPGVAPPGGVSAALLSPQGAGPPGNLGAGGGSGGGGGAGGGNGGGGAAGAAVPQGGFWGQLVSPAGDGSMGQDGFPTPGNIPGGMPFPGSAFGGQASTNGGSLAGVTTGGGGGGISSSALEQKLDEVIRVVRESNEEWQKRFVEEQEKNRQLFRELFMTFMGPRMSAPAT
ncbi:unnamed protein product [Closterium sp. NIES-64]|nr:unnamed protein product [Closterium sp. NIES-64]